MSNKRFNFLIIISILWIAGIFSLYIFGLFERPSSFNELGDFLAGVFAPVGFVWLIFGYLQQGKQLDQNTIALEHQINVHNDQINQMNESIKPSLKIEDCQCLIQTEYSPHDPLLKFNFTLTNKGLGEALNIEIKHLNSQKILMRNAKVNVNEKAQIKLDLLKSDFDHLYYSHWRSSITIDFNDRIGSKYNRKFNLDLVYPEDDDHGPHHVLVKEI